MQPDLLQYCCSKWQSSLANTNQAIHFSRMIGYSVFIEKRKMAREKRGRKGTITDNTYNTIKDMENQSLKS